MKLVYFDNSATTPTDFKVLFSMQDYFTEKFGNASEPHFFGVQAYEAVEKARAQVANLIGAKSTEIIFTSSATESINFSHKGLIEALIQKYPDRKKFHIITSKIEHKAVLETCKHLEKNKLVEITYLPVDNFGKVSIADLEKAIKDETVLVSVMYVNNEVGTIQPIEEIGGLLKQINAKRKLENQLLIYFHTDATQAVQYLNCNVDDLGIDLLSFTGHKIYAPKGIGILYIRKNTPILRQMDGGKQEFGLRSGTENVPYIVALGKACEIANKIKNKEADRLTKLRDLLISRILKIEGIKLTGHPSERVPHIASFLIEGAEGESIVLLLSNKGIISSTGSACNSNELKASHVLSAMGVKPEDSHGSLRLSLGRSTTKEDINYVMKVLPGAIKKLRDMSPK